MQSANLLLGLVIDQLEIHYPNIDQYMPKHFVAGLSYT